VNAQQHGSGAAVRRVHDGIAYASADPSGPDSRTALIEAIHHGKFTVADLHEVLRELDDAKSAAELWEDTAMKLKNRIVGDSIHTERWHVIAAELRNLTARVEGYEATGSLRHDEDTEPDLSNEPLGEIDV
jgi:hypothetical protein